MICTVTMTKVFVNHCPELALTDYRGQVLARFAVDDGREFDAVTEIVTAASYLAVSKEHAEKVLVKVIELLSVVPSLTG